MKHIFIILAIGIAVVFSSGCVVKTSPGEKGKAVELSVLESQATGQEAWQLEWEKAISRAKKEGSLVISTGRSEAMRDIVGSAFKKKYGIEIHWMVGSGSQTSARLAAERRAGIYTNDISIDGGNTSLGRYKEAGFLEPLTPAFILPEVRDQSAWLGGKFPFSDIEGLYVFYMTLYPQSPILYNTDLVNSEEFSSYQKLLDPKWKGKFIANDFTLTGGGLKWFGVMVEKDFGPILGLDYMKALAKQGPVIMRDDRLAGEWLIRGKYPFGLNVSIESQLAEWGRQGIHIPLKGFTPQEGGYVTTGGQNLTFFKNAPHPNAAKVFINWMLSREGATAMTRASIKHSSRIDIGDPRQIEPKAIVREPGLNYVNADQEKYLLKTDEYTKMAVEIFGHLIK